MKSGQSFYDRIKNVAKLGGGGNNDVLTQFDDNDRFRTYAERWILELARKTQWRDNPKSGPQITAYPDLCRKLASFPEPFLKEWVRYQTTKDSIDGWFKLTSEQRYQKRKSEWSSQCSVHMRYGNSYAAPDLPGCTSQRDAGCIPECEYYPANGSIDDEELLSWYANILEGRTYEQLKKDNDIFIQDFIKLLKKQANETPAAARAVFDQNYYPQLEDIAL